VGVHEGKEALCPAKRSVAQEVYGHVTGRVGEGEGLEGLGEAE
jgi:hypothetical protein